MLCFAVGTACLIGVISLVRARRRAHWRGARACGHRGHCGGWHRTGGWPRDDWRDDGRDDERDDERGGDPVLLRGLFERLRTTPGQERVITEALRELRAAFKLAAAEKAKGAKQVAEALRGDEFKVENMAESFAHLDSSVEAVRDASFSALAKMHEALDERQRRMLADLIARGGRALEHLAEQA